MANQNKTDIGLIGLAVMGENLALNMESKGWHVSVYNRTVPGVEEGINRHPSQDYDDGTCRQSGRRTDGSAFPFAFSRRYSD